MFSYVVRFASVRLFPALVAHLDLELLQINIKIIKRDEGLRLWIGMGVPLEPEKSALNLPYL